MKIPSLSLLLSLAAIAAQGWALILAVRSKRKAKDFRSAALAQFRSASIQASDQRYCFNGPTANVVRQDEFGPIQGIFSKQVEYRLTVYATNEAGEYFVFRSSEDGHGTVKHLEPKIAGVVLKDLYVAPSSSLANC